MTVHRALPTLVALLAAGCLTGGVTDLGSDGGGGPDDPEGADEALRHRVGAAPDPPPTPTLQVHALGVEAFEPSLGIDPDGRVFYRAASDPGGQDPGLILVSSDGKTWDETSPHVAGVGVRAMTNDPFLHVDPVTGRVYALDLLALVCANLSFSDDAGASWGHNPVGCGQPAGVHDQPYLITGPGGSPLHPRTVYYCASRVVDAVCASSLDGGQTFGPLTLALPPRPLENAPDSFGYCGTATGRVAAGPDGTVLLPADRCGVPVVARSTDAGLTWSEHPVGEAVWGRNDPEVTFDADGRAFAVWTHSDGLGRLAVSGDGGASWGEPFVVTAPNITAVDFLTVASARPGEAVVAYMGTTALGGYIRDSGGDPINDTVADDAEWRGYLGLVQGLGGDGAQVVTLPVEREGPLVTGQCGRQRCPAVADFIDVQAAQDGSYWAAFVDDAIDDVGDVGEALAVHLRPERP